MWKSSFISCKYDKCLIYKKKFSQFIRFNSKIRVNIPPQSGNFHNLKNFRRQCLRVCAFFHVCSKHLHDTLSFLSDAWLCITFWKWPPIKSVFGKFWEDRWIKKLSSHELYFISITCLHVYTRFPSIRCNWVYRITH